MAGRDCGRKAAGVPRDGRDSTSAQGRGCQPAPPDRPLGAAALKPRAHLSPAGHLPSLSISYQFAFNQPQHVSNSEPLSFPQSLQQSVNQVFTEHQLRGGVWGSRNSETGAAGVKSQPKVPTARAQGSGSDRAFHWNTGEEGVPGGWWAGEAFFELP